MNIDYIAGFIDGEGSITINNHRVRITIPQTNEEILEEIRRFFDVGRVCFVKKRKDHWKQSWVYCSGNNKNSLKILQILDGHLILKQDKLKEAIRILNEYYSVPRGHRDKINIVKELVKEGKSYRQIEKLIEISRTTICNYIKEK